MPVSLVPSTTLTKVSSGVMTSGSRPDRRVWRCWVMGKPFVPRIYTDEHGSSKSMLRKKPLQGSLLYPCSSVQIRGKKKSRRQRLRGHGLARREAGDGFEIGRASCRERVCQYV